MYTQSRSVSWSLKQGHCLIRYIQVIYSAKVIAKDSLHTVALFEYCIYLRNEEIKNLSVCLYIRIF